MVKTVISCFIGLSYNITSHHRLTGVHHRWRQSFGGTQIWVPKPKLCRFASIIKKPFRFHQKSRPITLYTSLKSEVGFLVLIFLTSTIHTCNHRWDNRSKEEHNHGFKLRIGRKMAKNEGRRQLPRERTESLREKKKSGG